LVVVGVAYAAFKEVAGSNLDGQHVAAAMPQYLTRSLSRSEFTVTDGDTIHIDGQSRGMRLVGLNAPETWQPQCPAEKALGERAKARLRQLVSSATLEVQRVPCSCPPGTEGTDSCNYGRSCGILRANGRDVGQVLIAEGLAVPFVCGVTRCPRTPRPWCG
jgi:endonuclease YncB( thermonuclease family)